MAFTKKIAGWVAGRVKGEQARKDTMRWMEKTGLGMILDAAGDAALIGGAVKGAGALKGLLGGQAAPLKALPAPGAATTTVAPRAATAVGTPAMASAAAPVAAPAAASTAAPMKALVAPGTGSTAMAPRAAAPMAAPMAAPAAVPRPMQAMVAPAAAPAPMAGGMTPQMRGAAQRAGGLENVANANVAGGPGGFRGAAQFARENAGWLGPAATATGNVIGSAIDRSVEEEKMRREQEARNRLAMLLMPMFQAQMGQVAPSFQPRG